MNWADSNLPDRKELGGAVPNERLLQAEGVGIRKVGWAKKQTGYCKVSFL